MGQSHVNLSIYNSIGQLVKVLINEFEDEGYYSVMFDGKDPPSGIYFYRLSASGASGNYSESKKMLLMK